MRSLSVPEVLQQPDPSEPKLTWYGDGGERIELSGRGLANWAIKAGNLLVSECDATEETTVLLDLPAHWRLLVWALGTWSVGATTTIDAAHGSDVLVTSNPAGWSPMTADLIAVALPGLARSWDGELPSGVIDGAAELMGQPDEAMFLPLPGPSAESAPAARELVIAVDPGEVIERAWSVWSGGGSAVLVTPRTDPELVAIAEQERIGG